MIYFLSIGLIPTKLALVYLLDRSIELQKSTEILESTEIPGSIELPKSASSEEYVT